MHVQNFTDHISDIFALPDADLPIPYTELLITAIPGYKRRAKGAHAPHSCLNQCSPAVRHLHMPLVCMIGGESGEGGFLLPPAHHLVGAAAGAPEGDEASVTKYQSAELTSILSSMDTEDAEAEGLSDAEEAEDDEEDEDAEAERNTQAAHAAAPAAAASGAAQEAASGLGGVAASLKQAVLG